MAVNVYAEHAPEVEMGISEYSETGTNSDMQATIAAFDKNSKSTTDHSKLEELEGPFFNGPEVTKACLSCHNKAGTQFLESVHWTWKYKHPVTGQELGKGTLVNNFCTNAKGNEGMCAQCHAGYGMKDDKFDFTNEENIDCLVCHESTGTYYKTPTSKGNKACAIMFEGKKPIEWSKVAQSVQMPGRNNCGKCHFFGGGGDNVKHGDLSSALFNPSKEIDVHMDSEGLDFACVVCHVDNEGHKWSGSRYNMIAKDEVGLGKPGIPRQEATCESCHSSSPHPITSLKGIKLNGHADRVACETCHIPKIAKGGVATQIDWDWRTMGKLKNGEGFKLKEYTQGNGDHRATYKSIKGDFKYDENFNPYYAWFDGVMNYTTIETKFDPATAPIDINGFTGDFNDPKSRIWPFKRMHTTQPYDKGNNTLVYMHLWGEDDESLWGNYSFEDAIKVGMEKNGIPYSGEYGFIETYSYWPINHMVSPKDDALACAECHARGEEGRLNELRGFYMPGRDYFKWLDIIGYLAIFGVFGVIFLHTMMRVLCKKGVFKICRAGDEK
ncbi:MAG: tetrathionate reductase family octaheme c-type cytochrome [Proteobacteria bacterium]|nr:tetrathionate reductase family octaheme c-type cytochrome [Pseudomonadota bacterium]